MVYILRQKRGSSKIYVEEVSRHEFQVMNTSLRWYRNNCWNRIKEHVYRHKLHKPNKKTLLKKPFFKSFFEGVAC